jgi:hypothetical protein
MKLLCTTAAAAAAVAAIWVSQVQAAPPTVTPSPGYDARLQEQRALSTFSTPTPPVVQPIHRRHRARHVSHY